MVGSSPGRTRVVEAAADGVVIEGGWFLPWVLLLEAEAPAGGARRLVFRAPDGGLVTVEAPADVRPPGLAPRPPSALETIPRVAVAAVAAGVVAAAFAAAAIDVLLYDLPVGIRSFALRRGAETVAAVGLGAGAAAGEGVRRALGARGALEEAEVLARRMEAAAAAVECRLRVRSVEVAWRCRGGAWERATSDERGSWTTRATPAEARAGLARLLAAGAAPEPRPIG